MVAIAGDLVERLEESILNTIESRQHQERFFTRNARAKPRERSSSPTSKNEETVLRLSVLLPLALGLDALNQSVSSIGDSRLLIGPIKTGFNYFRRFFAGR
jgi:hypothetical protein